MDSKVAVLGVVIAGVIASIVEPGLYTLGSTAVGATLWLVLRAYDDHPGDETRSQSAAYAAASAIILILVFGPLLNWLFFLNTGCPKPSVEQVLLKPELCFGLEPKDLMASSFNPNDLAFFSVWLVVGVLVFFVRRSPRWAVAVPLPLVSVFLVGAVVVYQLLPR